MNEIAENTFSSKLIWRVVIFPFCVICLIGIFVMLAAAYYLISPAEKDGQNHVFFVSKGLTLNEVADRLETKGIVTNSGLFILWARCLGYDRAIKAGEYRLNPSMPPAKILNILTSGAIITHPVTIPEGLTSNQIAVLLEGKGLVEKDTFVSLATNPDVAKRCGVPGKALEGFLFPDTYQFGLGIEPMAIIEVMVKRFWEVVLPLRERLDQVQLSLSQVIILASIVEKETGQAEERPIIASVFLNRLRKGMRLESDPTVIYGIKDFNGNLTKKDLSKPSPYNTYLFTGLPTGPIANPGIEAIKAVLYPADTDYLYFVSKNDGSHAFSKTIIEHNKAVQFYQKSSRIRQR